MKRLFISQPMGGRTDKEILKEREVAIQAAIQFLGEDVEVIDSFFVGADMNKPLAYLGESLKMMANADVVYFAPGWRDARGCNVEHLCCIYYGIPTIGEID